MRKAATSGAPNFFLGTDSAPHARDAKESGCGCAGIFNAPFALESYASVFEEEGALDRFEAFASSNGARFYGLPLNEGTVTLERADTHVPETIERVTRAFPRRRDTALEIGRLIRPRRCRWGRSPRRNVFEPLVAFARPALEAGAVEHPDDSAARRDQPFRRQLLDHRVDRRALDSEQAGKRLLGQLDPVAGAICTWSSQRAARSVIEWNALHATDCMTSPADNPNSGRTGWR